MGNCLTTNKHTYEPISTIEDEVFEPPPTAFPYDSDIEQSEHEDYEIIENTEVLKKEVKTLSNIFSRFLKKNNNKNS